jgi:hypothetical protein
MKKSIIVVYIFMIILITTCEGQNSKFSKEFPGVDVLKSDTNKEISLSVLEQINTFIIGDPVFFFVENLASTPISFPSDYGTMIYLRENNHWVQIENDMGYSSGPKILQPKNQMLLGGIVIGVHPALQGTRPVKIRIFIIGQIRNQNSNDDEQVGAWIDVELNP